jgi:hypothetical protein
MKQSQAEEKSAKEYYDEFRFEDTVRCFTDFLQAKMH